MTVTNYELMYKEIVEALGYDNIDISNENTDEEHDKRVKVAQILRRVAVTMQTSIPEQSGAMFICGFGGEYDDMGLPERIHVCPTYGLAGTAIYTKTTEYSEPGW